MKRSCRTPEYNWNFDLETGYFQRWGRKLEDDPQFSPLGPEILDIEIGTACGGNSRGECSYCYKGNTSEGKCMSVETYCDIIDKVPFNLMQVALGIGDTDNTPQLQQILQETRYRGIVPNITINGYSNTDQTYSILAGNCGSIAVSCYEYERCLSTVDRLAKEGACQINIHQVVSRENYQQCLELISKLKDDPRAENMNALVFLMLKPKGRAKGILPPTFNQFGSIIKEANDARLKMGFDSCSAPATLKYFEESEELHHVARYVEPCESFLFSAYCNVDGEFFPCSFCEGESGWEKGLKIENDFLQDVWFHERTLRWRESLYHANDKCICGLKRICRLCPVYKTIKLC